MWRGDEVVPVDIPAGEDVSGVRGVFGGEGEENRQFVWIVRVGPDYLRRGWWLVGVLDDPLAAWAVLQRSRFPLMERQPWYRSSVGRSRDVKHISA